MSDDEDDVEYRVVINHEEQYSIWPADRPVPDGWREAGFTGLRGPCLAWIDEVWTDMRPLSLRRWLEDPANTCEAAPAYAPEDDVEPLAVRLSNGQQPVELVLRQDNSAGALREHLARGYVTIRFRDTRGGTELGFEFDPAASTVDVADEPGSGLLHLEGDLVLDFEPVRCTADIDPATLRGEGRLVVRTGL